MADEWAQQCRRLLATIIGRAAPTHGYPPRAIEAAESRLGVRLPELLRDYYLSVGRHKINQVHNRLLPPTNLEVSQGRLVFMEENQNVVVWGVRARTAATDPIVFQTPDPDDEEWVAESRCSQFLPSMLCWQAVSGGLPYIGYSNPFDPVVARRLARGWPSAGRIGTLSAFARDGQVLCVLDEGESALVHVGSRSQRGFRELVSELGVEVHEL